MAGIFISWGSVDKAVCDALIARLRGLGLDPPKESSLPRVLEYSHEMSAGDNIPGEVMGWIASIAVPCLSDATLKRRDHLERRCAAARRRHASARIPIKAGR
jgi:hypothetical protein